MTNQSCQDNNNIKLAEAKKTEQPTVNEEENDTHVFTTDEKLIDHWPEEFPGITRFADLESGANLQFDRGDIVLINSLANLAPGALVDELKAMKAIASRLAIDEEQEKARGKILRVLLG